MLAPFSVKLEGVFIERVPRCTRLSGSRFLTALRFEVFPFGKQLPFLPSGKYGKKKEHTMREVCLTLTIYTNNRTFV